LDCYNFDAHEWILIFFGRLVTDEVGNQKTLYYATSNNLCHGAQTAIFWRFFASCISSEPRAVHFRPAFYTVSQKKRTTFTTCYNFYIHSSIVTIFGNNVAEKVGNQNVLYFPTSPN